MMSFSSDGGLQLIFTEVGEADRVATTFTGGEEAGEKRSCTAFNS